jgi:hypothetical protein
MGRFRGRKEFTRRPHDKFLYRWKPETDLTKKAAPERVVVEGCTATPNSQGIDNDVTYVYELQNVNGVLSRIAYVACDYVE